MLKMLPIFMLLISVSSKNSCGEDLSPSLVLHAINITTFLKIISSGCQIFQCLQRFCFYVIFYLA